jgi:hypothetical protein
MKNEDLWKQYSDYSAIVSENFRKLAFAAAAICWLFKPPEKPFPKIILYGIWFIVLFFIFDILQYFVAALLLRFWTRCQEKKNHAKYKTIMGEYDKPAWLDTPPFHLWWFKVVLLFVAYGLIGFHILKIN